LYIVAILTLLSVNMSTQFEHSLFFFWH